MTGLSEALAAFSPRFEAAFSDRLEAALAGAPDRLQSAIRHGALAGGKRIRPFLLCRAASLFGISETVALPAACAIECIHCYSLVHDDLPAMDNDSLRRGKPTVHVAFDEATAILAGDTLLTLAFECLADCSPSAPLTRALARASGGAGMAGGQMLDLAAEGRFGAAGKATSEASIRQIQAMKTGALITAACEMGGLVGKADDASIEALRAYGAHVGLAFQIADDLLDAEGDTRAVGKAVGKDAGAGKATFVALRGADGTRALLRETVAAAHHALKTLPGDTSVLADLAVYIAERDR